MAFTKAGLWGPQAIIDSSGHPQPGATATLYLPDEVTLASLWTTSAKSVAVANPTQADIHANLHFYADPGQYRLKVNVGTVVTWLDVEVPIDPGEAAQDQDVVAAQAAAEAYADGIVAAGLATKQPLDSDLTAIAALSTTAFGRGLLILADAAAGRAAFGSVIGTDVQAHDSDLDAIAALATTAFGRALLVLADAAALRTAAGLGSAATHASTDFDAAGAASAAVTALVAGAPGALDTLNELATALADDANFATTITNALAGKQQAVARTAVKTTNYLAAAGDLVPVDTTSGAVTVTLPNAPTDKSTIAVKHIIQGGTNVVTIACAGADVFNRAGGGTSATLPYANQAMLLEYTAAGAIWSVIADDLPLSQLDLRFAPITGIPESAVTSLATDLAAKAPILAPTAVKTGNYTAAVGDYVLCDTSGGIFTVTLPTAPADKTSIAVDLVASGNTLTIARGGADVFQKAGGPTALTMNTANRVLVLQYQSSIAVWHVQDHLPAVITTKGDLLTYSTERARLAVGADGALLGADSTQATGLKWIPSGTYAASATLGVTAVDTTNAQTVAGAKTYTGDARFKSGRPHVDVQAFLAVGDGITDDTTAVQNAVNAAVALGHCDVVLPAAAGYLCGTITCTGTGITFRGQGPFLQRAADHNGIDLSNSTDCKVKGLTMTGVGGTVATGGNNAVYGDTATRPMVVGCTMSGWRQDGVQFLNSTGGVVERNRLRSMSYGMWFQQCSRFSVALNELRDPQTPAATFIHGIGLDSTTSGPYTASGCADFTISHNIIKGYVNAQSILAHSLNRGTISGNVMEDSLCGISLVSITSLDIISKVTITGNTYDGTVTTGAAGGVSNYGIQVTGSASPTYNPDNITIVGNTLVGANAIVQGTSQGGIGFGYCSSLVISGNTIDGCYANGVVWNNPALRCFVGGNIIRNVQSVSGTQFGVYLAAAAQASTGAVGPNLIDGASGLVAAVRSDVTSTGVAVDKQYTLGTYTNAITSPNHMAMLVKPSFGGGQDSIAGANPPVSGTTYRNNTGRFVRVELPAYATTPGTAGTVTVGLDTVNPTVATLPVRRVDDASTAALPQIVDFVVPPGCFWSVTASGVTLATAAAYAVA